MSVRDKTLAALKRLDKRFSKAENWIKGTWAGYGFIPGKSVNENGQVVSSVGYHLDGTEIVKFIDSDGKWLNAGQKQLTEDGKVSRCRVKSADLKEAKKCDQFCLEGAMYRVGIKENDPAWKIVEGVAREQSGHCIFSFNDAEETTFPMVRDVVTRAIEKRKDQLAAVYRAKL